MKVFPKAITLGFIANVLVTIIAIIVIGVIFGTQVADQNVMISALLFGIITNIVGGYVTSHKSPSSKAYNGFLLGVIGVLIALVLNIFISYPFWFNMISIVLIIPTNLAGVYIDHFKERIS